MEFVDEHHIQPVGQHLEEIAVVFIERQKVMGQFKIVIPRAQSAGFCLAFEFLQQKGLAYLTRTENDRDLGSVEVARQLFIYTALYLHVDHSIHSVSNSQIKNRSHRGQW